jgi:RNA-directed DNA polymerase|uniref:Putative reverse transcriptase and intron maturase n=1 Tax=Chara vulgaris TaxID=55564 RepID=Q7YAJ7_CHAVU|nr:putative reverse transcriptase and intron maturase [Chara vulgaris]AAP92209.1 putative reverse transcriptase and intron maturase [Chara vulgaris]
MSRMYLNVQGKTKIPWTSVESFVFRFQTRIYKASKDKNYGKMRALQTRLAQSLHARLLAVRRVTMDNSSFSMELVRTLKFDASIRGTKCSLDTKCRDRAKQALAKMVLEPEWEARFEPHSYGFRPGREAEDAMEALASLANAWQAVLLADIKWHRINTSCLLEKLDISCPVMRNQIKAWLKADIMTGFRPGPLAPLLANIALHGMENAAQQLAEGRVILVRYADDFVVLHKAPRADAKRNKKEQTRNARRVVQGAASRLSQWLQPMGLHFVPSTQRTTGFHFLAHDGRVAPSKKSQETLLSQTRFVIQSHKGSAVHRLISALVPLISGWGNYFKFSECSAIFHRMDFRIFQQLRAWVFRRHPTWGRQRIKHKYFPENQTWLGFHGKKYRDNWVLYDSYMSKDTRRQFNLIRLSWIKKSCKHEVVRSSPFDGDLIYWSLRLYHKNRGHV